MPRRDGFGQVDGAAGGSGARDNAAGECDVVAKRFQRKACPFGKLKASSEPNVLVEKLVIVEAKAVTVYNPIFEAQALTYLRLLDLRLALVINFGEKLVKNGIHRVVNGL
ncbi:MAG: GxxExxY protein [Chloroflexi bacterium]|nr:GxxExxY protein [Chloroflexota bacterium]